MIVRKVLAVVVILLFIGVSIPSTATVAEKKSTLPSFYDGDTLYVGGSGPNNYTKIQDAIDNSSDGDTVFVYDDSSPYYENVIVDKTINLIGEDRNTTIIDGENGNDNIVYVSADWVNICGFTIRNSGWSNYSWNAGIAVISNSNNISSSNIMNAASGMYFSYSENNKISDNSISDGGCGLTFFSSNKNDITDNTISSNSCGISFYHNSNNNTVSNNGISNNRGEGIYIGGDSNNNNNNIYHNNFINNVQNAYDKCNNTWDNGCLSGGNYYSDYTGDDFYHGLGQNELGRDWRGDTPYNISGGSNQDRYPLILPYESERPFAIIEHPSDGLITSEHNVTIIGHITDNVGLVKSGTSHSWDCTMIISERLHDELILHLDFEFVIELKPGRNGIGIHATDPSNNKGHDRVWVYYYPDIVYVDDDYNSSTQGWQQYCFNSIQDGVDVVAESGTVYVYNGTYYENVIVDKSINLIGENRDTTVIDGSGSRYVVRVFADYVNISGFTIRSSEGNYAGIDIISDYNTITDNNISNNYHGINIHGSSNNITGNNISNNYCGIHISGSNNNNIVDNIITSNNYCGIDFPGGSSNNTGVLRFRV